MLTTIDWRVRYPAAALLGAILGLTSWWLQFSGYTAVKIIAVDRATLVGSMGPTPVVDTNFLIEFIKSQDFARRVALRSGNDEIAKLAAKATEPLFGVRLLFGGNSIELRYGSNNPDLARTAMDAAGAEVVQFMAAKTAAVVAALSDTSEMPRSPAIPDAISVEIARKTWMERTVSIAMTKNQSGMALETTINPPGHRLALMLLGAVAGIIIAILVGWGPALLDTKFEKQQES